MQVSGKNTDVLASPLTDHLPITFLYCKNEETDAFRNLRTAWLKTKNMFTIWKKIISDTLNELSNENILDDQVKWKYLKYHIRKYTINFSKKLAKNTNKKITDLKAKLKHFEKHYENYVDNIDYKVFRQQLDAIYEEKAKGIKIRSKCNWYELGEKSTKFFLNLEKQCAFQSLQIWNYRLGWNKQADIFFLSIFVST